MSEFGIDQAVQSVNHLSTPTETFAVGMDAAQIIIDQHAVCICYIKSLFCCERVERGSSFESFGRGSSVRTGRIYGRFCFCFLRTVLDILELLYVVLFVFFKIFISL